VPSTVTVTVGWEPGTEVLLPPWPMNDIGRRVYESMGPYTHGDEAHGWALAAVINGIASVLQPIQDLAADRDDGTPGWEAFIDPERTPSWALAWLAQTIGVQLPEGVQAADASATDIAAARAAIANRSEWRRGTPSYVRAVAAPFLKQGAQIVIRERFNPAATEGTDAPWHGQVRIRSSDVMPGQAGPLTAAVLRAIPAGLLYTVEIADYVDFEQIRSSYSNFAAVKAANTDFADVKNG
jgi:hypothetical protein